MVFIKERHSKAPISNLEVNTQHSGNKLVKKQPVYNLSSGLLAEILFFMSYLYSFVKLRPSLASFFLFFFLVIFSSQKAKAQLDTEFWFAPPELTESIVAGTGGPRDRPIQLVVSTLEKAARIEILQPADLTFTPIVLNLPANSTQIVNLTPFINRLESKPENTVLKTGILIRSTNSISAYYEIKSTNNTDIFALKGANANGKLFYVPFLTHWNNATDLNGALYEPTTFASFDIVAIDDSTLVTVTPKKALVGHPAGIPFSFRLDRGQVYSCRAIDRVGANHPAGSKIESTKDIAVTMKDDMLQFNPPVPGADIAGDQLIPVELLGNSYVLVKGGLTNNQDRCYILATENNTIIRIDGNAIPLDTLDEGEQYELQMTKASYFLSANKKVSVLHISGIADQVAGAIIPALTCTGTNRIGFTRTNASRFIVNVITKNSAKNNFTLNDDPNLVPGSAFEPILGSNGWVFARIEFSTSEIPAGTTLLLKNTGDELFHVGVTNYAAGVGSNYGYFSNFSRLNLGSDKSVCVGDTAVLDAGPAKTSYLWNTGSTQRIVETIEPGTYWVNTLSGSQCPKTDTIRVRFYAPTFSLGPDDTICIGATRLIEPSGVFTFTWQDGSTQPTFLATQAGAYWAQIADFQGCTTRDSIIISEFPRPNTPIASVGDTVCKGGQVSLTMGNVNGATYAWMDPNDVIISGKSILVNTSIQPAGAYKAFIKIDGCESFFDTSFVGVVDPPAIQLGPDTVICSAAGTVLLDPGKHKPGYFYEWSTGSSDSLVLVSASGKYKVKVSDPSGCFSEDSLNVLFQSKPATPTLTSNSTFCSNQPASFGVIPLSGQTYKWAGPNNFTSTGPNVQFSSINTGDAGVYSFTPFFNGCPGDTSTRLITVNPSPNISLGKDSSSCSTFGLALDPTPFGNGLTYLWSDNSTDSLLTVTTQGTYSVAVSDAFCTSRDTIQIQFGVGPITVTQTGLKTYCSGLNTSFGVIPQTGETYSWTGPNGFTFTGPLVEIPNIQTNQAGNYFVTPSLPGCIGTATPVALIVRPSPILSPMIDTSICFTDGSTVLDPVPNGGEDVFYTWNNGLADSSIVVTSGGTYSVIASTGFCQVFDTVLVTTRPSPGPIAFTTDSVFCLGQNVSLGIAQEPGTQYAWTGPSGFTSFGNTISISNLQLNQIGNYFVTPTLGTCPGTPVLLRLRQATSPQIQLSDDTSICSGNSVIIDPVVFGNGYSYSWNNGSTDSVLTISTVGKYIVTVSNGICSLKDSINVTSGNTPADVSISGITANCSGDALALSVVSENNVSYSWSGPNGFTANNTSSISIPSLQLLQAGDYIVMSDLNGCKGKSDTVTITVNSKPIISLGSNDTLCNIPSTLVLDPTPNGLGFTYQWNTGTSDSTLSVLTSGSYSVLVSNGNCTATDTVEITIGTTPSKLVINSTTTVLCQGDAASFNVSPIPGTNISWTGPGGFTFSGSSLSLTNIQPIQTGLYIASTSQNACPGIGDSVTLSIGIKPAIELGNNVSICSGASVTLDPTPSGAGLTYLWSNNSTDSSLVVFIPGVYTVSASGGGTCIAKDTITVNVGIAPNPVTVTGDTIYCSGNNASLGVVGQPGAVYTWTGPNGFTQSDDTITIANLSPLSTGTYKVVPSLSGCLGIADSVNLTIIQAPIVNLGPDDTICGNELVILDPTNDGSSGFIYNWSVGSSDSTLNVNQSGQYSVTVRQAGCVKSDTINLQFNSIPTSATIVGNQNQCAGDTVEFTLQGVLPGASYAWTGPNGFNAQGQTATLSPITLTNSGTYTVTSKLDGCLGLPTSITIIVNQRPFAELGLDLQSCAGTIFTLDPNPASGGLTFLWNTNSTDSSINVSESGQYSVIVSNGSICTAKDTVNVSFTSFPTAPTFSGDTAYCVGESNSFGVEAANGVTYSWTGPDNFSFSGPTISITNAQLSQSGYYKVRPNAGSCLGPIDSVFLLINSFPTVDLGKDSSFCGSVSFPLSAGNTPGLTYLWNTGSVTQGINVSITGIYSVKVSSEALCSATDSIYLVFKPNPDQIEILQGSKSACNNTSVTFSVEDQPLSQLSWTGPNGFTATGPTISLVANELTKGSYFVSVRQDGCLGETKEISLVNTPIPTVSIASDTLLCIGQKTLATATASAGANIFWSTNAPGSTAELVVGTHWVEASLNGCRVRDSITIKNAGPTAKFAISPDQVILYEEAKFIDQSIPGKSAIVTWSWDLGFSQVTNLQNPKYTFTDGVETDVQLIITDAKGCVDTLVKNLTLNSPSTVWNVPTLFTPNGDGENDFFSIGDMVKYPGTKISIFNRWGIKEFSSDNYDNKWQGEGLVEGVYYYDIVRNDGFKTQGYVYLRR